MKQPIFFDVDGVLIDGYNYQKELRKPWDKNLQEDLGVCPTLFTQEFIFKRFADEVIIGKTDLHTALAEELPKLGYNIDPQLIVDYWLRKDSIINKNSLSHIKALQRSDAFSLFMATNQEHNRANHLMQNLGFNQYFQDIFHSAKVGTTKKDLSYFKLVDEALGIPRHIKPIFFDDTPDIVENAKIHGWDAYLFTTSDDIFQCQLLQPYLTDIA